MPHFPKPFFKASRARWYVQIGDKQVNLGADKEAAFERYHELMRQRPNGKADATLVVGVFDLFLENTKANKSARTYEWYARHLNKFAKSIPSLLSISEMTPHHVTKFLDRERWSPTTKNGLCRAVVRAFAWARRQRLIRENPVDGMEKPKAVRREIHVTESDFRDIMEYFTDNAFRDLLTAAWDTAARPQELVAVEARHCDLAMGRWVFPAEESKGKRCPRVVWLGPRVIEICRRLVLKHPSGPLFRNEDGKPWTRFAIKCRFDRLRIHLGKKYMKENGIELSKIPGTYERRKVNHKLARQYGKNLCLYSFRHGWATRAIKNGCDPLTAGILMGHSDPSMLAKVYAHLAQDPEYLRSAAKRARGECA